jgi:hypothetical protein
MIDLTKLANTPLFRLNPDMYKKDPIALAHIVYRYSRPWEETVSLNPAKELICDIFEVPETHPLVGALLENPEIAYHMSDFFSGGGAEVTVVRVITITNGIELAAVIEAIPEEEWTFWMRELTHFGGNEPHMFIADGLILISADYLGKNQLLWDGEHFRSIKHKEHDFFVEPGMIELEDTTIHTGGYHYAGYVAHVAGLIEQLHKGRYCGQDIHVKAVGKPFYLIQNVYAFMDDVISASAVLFGKLINLENEPPETTEVDGG